MSILDSKNKDRTNLPDIDITKVDQYIIDNINQTSGEFIFQMNEKWVDLNNTYYHTLPNVSLDHPCMWDSLSEEDKKIPMMLSCPCPKCSVWC